MPEIAAVGAVALRAGHLLLIRRGHAPSRGRWSLPGGRVEPGETAEQALAREMTEETGLVVEVGDFVGEVVRAGPGDVTYRIRDFLVTPIGGAERAGDDAKDLAWVRVEELGRFRLSEGLLEALQEWALL